MRWLAALVGLGLTMALLGAVTATGPVAARATLALGWLLLLALVAGEVALRAGLPRVTGYVLAGFAAGGSGLALVRADELGALRVLLDAVVGFIAIAAGLEIRTQLLRRHARAIVRTSGAALLAPWLAVAVFVLLASPWFPLTGHQPWGDRVIIALTLGALAAASSPVMTMAVMDELRAHGPFARLLLAVTVLKDVAVLAGVALVLALGRVLGSSGALDPGVLWRVPLTLVGSLGAGAALGWAAGVVLRRGLRDGGMMLVTLAVLAALGAHLWGLEALLVGLAAGCVVTNAPGANPAPLRGAVQRWSRPVYAVGFALAGAGLQLGAVAAAWWWVVALVALRALALRYGLWWAGRDVSVPPQLARSGWPGLVPQAGVALGLAVVVRRAFPEWGVSLEAFVLAMIGVHELIGPVLARRALQHDGDEEGRHVEASESDGVALLSRGSVQ